MKAKIITISLLLTILTIPCFPQQVTKVLVSGLGGTHDQEVASSFQQGYASYDGTNFSGTIDTYYDPSSDIQSSFNYAQANGYNVIVRSTTGLTSVISQAANYPNITVFMPAGSNSFVQVYTGNVDTSPVIITGAGTTHNETGYNVEFFSIDPIDGEPALSSFSNGYIAGEICYLANHLNMTVQDARQLAKTTSSTSGTYDQYDGYGQVMVQSAVSSLPVELELFTGNRVEQNVDLKWQTSTEVDNYGFDIERSTDKVQWSKLGFVKGSGNSNSPKEYNYTDTNPLNTTTYYRLKQIDNDSKYKYSQIIEVSSNSPAQFVLEQNYPNPFNPSTTIKYSIPDIAGTNLTSSTIVQLKVYDELGREIKTLVNKEEAPGEYEVKWNAMDFASGIYFFRLSAGKYHQMKKMILIK